MEIIAIAANRRFFQPSTNRYDDPHKEAMLLRQLWTNIKPPSKMRDGKTVANLYKEVSASLDDEEKFNVILGLIKKGLSLDPRFHMFYSIRGDIYMRQGKWFQAIKSYESARSTVKFDKKFTVFESRSMYSEKLLQAYKQRADQYLKDSLLLEAVADYEQVLQLKSPDTPMPDVEDKLLGILRRMKRYEAFVFHWRRFTNGIDPVRTSVLLTKHAEYKIHFRELSTARRLLYRAVELDKNNKRTQELLQVVYNTGHTMAAFTVIWCIHGCYDKALMTIEKGRDCDPINPGYTLLKTIVLRLSGRLTEAENWLQKVSKDFKMLLEPSRDTKGSIMGKLSTQETRKELTMQWYLIRYDLALRYYLNDEYHKAAWVIERSNLTKYFTESYIILGDCFLRDGKVQEALQTYFKCREKCKELGPPKTRKNLLYLLERVTDVLNRQASSAANAKRSKDCVRLAEQILELMDEERVEMHSLTMQRGRALLNKARAYLQMSKKDNDKSCCQIIADSLRFSRNLDECELYRNMHGKTAMEDLIDRFAPRRKLPQSLKILLQYTDQPNYNVSPAQPVK